MAVSSPGGHWVQLNNLNELFVNYELVYVTTFNNKISNENGFKVEFVVDCSLNNPIKSFICAIQIFWYIFMIRPKCVVSTGAAPGAFAVLWGRLFGIKTIWIDSLANTQKISLSGRICLNFVDIFLTQWPDLADGKKIRYEGNVL